MWKKIRGALWSTYTGWFNMDPHEELSIKPLAPHLLLGNQISTWWELVWDSRATWARGPLLLLSLPGIIPIVAVTLAICLYQMFCVSFVAVLEVLEAITRKEESPDENDNP